LQIYFYKELIKGINNKNYKDKNYKELLGSREYPMAFKPGDERLTDE
jgi:hypothetical protein